MAPPGVIQCPTVPFTYTPPCVQKESPFDIYLLNNTKMSTFTTLNIYPTWLIILDSRLNMVTIMELGALSLENKNISATGICRLKQVVE